MRNLLLILTLFFAIQLRAQTGPAGVGNSSNNGLWLRADAINLADSTSLSTWADTSGNDNDAIQLTAGRQPIFYDSSALNKQPVVRLDGNNDQLVVADADILDNTSAITYFAVIRPYNIDGSARGILGKRITFTVSEQYAYTWFLYTGNRMFLDTHTNNDRFSTGTSFSNSTNYILSWRFNGNLAASQRSRMWSGSTIVATSSDASTSLPNSNQAVAIGALNVDYGTYFNADYAEIIHFNYEVDSLERILINNYLSAKYNISIAANDLYVQDNPANGDYDFDVAGIGRIDASTIQDTARGSGILTVLNPTDLDNNEYLIWGHNGDTAQAVVYDDIPAEMEGRFQRVWRFSEVDGSGSSVDVGDVDLRWDLNNLGPITTTDLRLLIDSDGDGFFNDETPISGAVHLGGNSYEFSSVSGIEDGTRMTIGTIDIAQSPLPIELVDFNVKAIDTRNALINWSTASEVNNDYFTLLKSKDGINWEEFQQLNGAGNSTKTLNYQLIDSKPYYPTCYYKLKQTDFNGESESFAPKSIQFRQHHDLNEHSVFPNPVREKLRIRLSEEVHFLRLMNVKGQTFKLAFEQDEHTLFIDVSTLKKGTYYLQINHQFYPFIKQ
tara:strand:- start:4918 stop:6747 length:1830 start_codon:yes stop_codon:yes gene_type:complete